MVALDPGAALGHVSVDDPVLEGNVVALESGHALADEGVWVGGVLGHHDVAPGDLLKVDPGGVDDPKADQGVVSAGSRWLDD